MVLVYCFSEDLMSCTPSDSEIRNYVQELIKIIQDDDNFINEYNFLKKILENEKSLEEDDSDNENEENENEDNESDCSDKSDSDNDFDNYFQSKIMQKIQNDNFFDIEHWFPSGDYYIIRPHEVECEEENGDIVLKSIITKKEKEIMGLVAKIFGSECSWDSLCSDMDCRGWD